MNCPHGCWHTSNKGESICYWQLLRSHDWRLTHLISWHQKNVCVCMSFYLFESFQRFPWEPTFPSFLMVITFITHIFRTETFMFYHFSWFWGSQRVYHSFTHFAMPIHTFWCDWFLPMAGWVHDFCPVIEFLMAYTPENQLTQPMANF